MPFHSTDSLAKYTGQSIKITDEIMSLQVWGEACGFIQNMQCYDYHPSPPKRKTLKPINMLSCISNICPVCGSDHVVGKENNFNLFNLAFDPVKSELILICYTTGKKKIKKYIYTEK